LSFDEALFKNTIARDTQYRFSCFLVLRATEPS